MEKHFEKRILSNLETASFCEQLSMILKSGISVMEGLSILLEDAQNKDELALLQFLYEKVCETGELYPALEESGIFPAYALHLIKLGEETGQLDEVLTSLSHHYYRENVIAQNIKNALTYPAIMIGMMLIIIFVLITQVMPVFNRVFQQLGQEMEGISRGILLLGTTLSRYALIFIGAIALLLLVVVYLTRSKKGQVSLRSLSSHLSFSRELYHKISACRFASGMALALKSGLTLERGIELSESLIEDTSFQKEIDSCKSILEEGHDFSKACHKAHIFTGLQARTLSIAEKTGFIEEALDQVASQYEEQVDEKISSFLSALEPTLVILLSVIVGIILLSVMLPLLEIMSGM